jgi:hypothetical protein
VTPYRDAIAATAAQVDIATDIAEVLEASDRRGIASDGTTG